MGQLLENMICLTASTPFPHFSYNHPLLHHFVEFIGGYQTWRKF